MYCVVEFGKRTRHCGVCREVIKSKAEAHLRVYTLCKGLNICCSCLNNFAYEATYKLPFIANIKRRANENKKTS